MICFLYDIQYFKLLINRDDNPLGLVLCVRMICTVHDCLVHPLIFEIKINECFFFQYLINELEETLQESHFFQVPVVNEKL